MLAKNRAILQNFKDAVEHEWLETNGLGGWASSSIIGANTRRYHGLLVAAITSPADRLVLLSKLDETIVIPAINNAGQNSKTRFELGVNLFPGNSIQPYGHHYISAFSKDQFPHWVYEAGGVKLKKTIAMIHGENTVVIMYQVMEATRPFTLELLPLMAARAYHSLNHEGPHMHWEAEFENDIFHSRPDGKTVIFISIPGSSCRHDPIWFKDFQYPVEQYRGLEFSEDLLNHGIFEVKLTQGDSLGIIVSVEDPSGREAEEILLKEKTRRQLLISNQPDDELVNYLVLAADQFIVQRHFHATGSQVSPSGASDPPNGGEAWERSSLEGAEAGASIIAGYHWFTDWGRDTMISLPGLCLSTGRYNDAKKILSGFAKIVNQGMLPTRFNDYGEAPEYNNVDGTLWFFIAAHRYLKATGDTAFVLNEILPVFKDIIDWHFRGTRFNIHVDEDGLLFAGEEGQQLTWMDARIGNWVVTPRMGKPVEIQALWYNALRIFAALLRLNEQEDDAVLVNASAEKAKQSFDRQFWYAEGNYLYDNIDEKGKPVAEFRPNQIFAISLPFPLIEDNKAKLVMELIEEQLYTPVGLRTLPRNAAHYAPAYGGDRFQRDSAYHQGTVWSWLLGPYVDAMVKVGTGKAEVKNIIEHFAYHLNEGCLGSVSEIFDAEPPHHPRGCIAQAWGVAEMLRVIKDHRLYEDKTGVEENKELEMRNQK